MVTGVLLPACGAQQSLQLFSNNVHGTFNNGVAGTSWFGKELLKAVAAVASVVLLVYLPAAPDRCECDAAHLAMRSAGVATTCITSYIVLFGQGEEWGAVWGVAP